jgi:hypothetical protein
MGFKQGELLAIKAEIEALITRRETLLAENEAAKAKGEELVHGGATFNGLEDRFWNIVTYVKAHEE